MRTWLGVVIAVAACKGKAVEKRSAALVPVVATAGSAAGSDSRSGSAARPRKQASNEQRAAYKQHMKAGWALQKQQKWAESVPEFEAAVAAIDGDQRALAELGWSAMNAGDYKKARRADDLAVRVALDPKVKASALFNLGTVEAKTGNVDDARVSYAESLKLRPNKTVEAELAKLGAAPAVEKPFCETGKDPCKCVSDDIAGPDADRECDITTNAALPATWKIYTASSNGWTFSYVLDEHNNYMFQSARSDDHVRHIGDMKLDKVETKTLGTHKVLWIAQTENDMETVLRGDDGETETEIDETRALVTLCVLADPKTPARCPLREVPVDRTYEGEGSDKSETVADVVLTDGTATVKLVSGPSCCGLDAMIGPHALW